MAQPKLIALGKLFYPHKEKNHSKVNMTHNWLQYFNSSIKQELDIWQADGHSACRAGRRAAKSIFGGLKNSRWHSLLKVGTQLILIKKGVSYKIREGATSNFANLRVLGVLWGSVGKSAK